MLLSRMTEAAPQFAIPVIHSGVNDAIEVAWRGQMFPQVPKSRPLRTRLESAESREAAAPRNVSARVELRMALGKAGIEACVIYIGDPAGAKTDLQVYGTIEKVLADAILMSTNPGMNLVKIDEQPYRFIRSFMHIHGHDAVVFSVV